MNAVLLPLPAGEGGGEGQPRVEEPSARYLVDLQPPMVRCFDLLATAPQGVAKLRELILSLAVRGKLVPQSADDAPVASLLAKIEARKSERIAAGEMRREKPVPNLGTAALPHAVPAVWAWKRIGELGQIVGGGTPKSDDPSMWTKDGIPWLTPADLYGLQSKRIARGRRDISERGLDQSSAQVLPEGSILFSSRAPIGYVALAANPLATNQGFKSCVPHVDQLSDYLYWYLKYVAKAIDAAASGTTFKEISGSEFAEVPVPVPPLAEQARIVARVEELMKLCDALEERGRLEAEQHARLLSTLLDSLAASENAQALAENWQRIAQHFDLLLDRPEAVDALEQTILQLAVRGLLVPQDQDDEPASSAINRIRGARILLAVRNKIDARVEAEAARPFNIPATWEWCALGELALEGPNNGLSPKPSPVATAVRCLTLSATTRGYFRPECYKHVDIPNSVARQFFLKHGDLLIQRANSLEYVGVAAIYDQADDLFIYPDLMMRLRLTHEVSLKFVHMFLVCKEGRRYFQSRATGTQGNMPKVNQGVVCAVPIPFPPLSEQHRIVARVQQLRALCAQLRERLQQARHTQGLLANVLVENTVISENGGQT